MAVPMGPAAGGGVLGEIAAAGGRLAGMVRAAAGAAAGSVLGAVPLMVIPTNTQSETHPIVDGLRVRTAPGQRSATLELRVGNGWLGTGIGERWERLPVDAEVVVDSKGRPSIAIDQLGLDAALQVHGSAMARPPSDGGDRPGAGQRPVGPGHNNPPEPTPPEPPLNPEPRAAPIIKNKATSSAGQDAKEDDARRRKIREIAEYIGAGHARGEHLDLRREYPGTTPLEFVNLIEQTMLHPTYQRDFPRSGRKAYWDGKSKLLVVEDPNRPDWGSAFKRPDGPEYIRTMRDR